MCKAERAIIIGGGIGGLSTAAALRMRGIEALVFERAGEPAEVGAGITLWPNAIRVLRKLGLASAVIDAGARLREGRILTGSGRLLATSRMDDFEIRYGEPVVALHRADLQRILFSAVGDSARFGMELKCFQETAGSVVAIFTDGTTAEGDLLIGADGVNSSVRKQMAPGRRNRYAGYTAWRGVLEDDGIDFEWSSESWGRGKRFGIVPLGNGRLYWFATENCPQGRRLSPSESKGLLSRIFRDWHTPIPDLIRNTPAHSVLNNDIIDQPPAAGWRSGRVVLVGDAAHATTPNLGQGACMAIEDGLALATHLAGEPTLDSALDEFEAERLPRTARVTRESWRLGRLGQLEGRLACAVRDTALALSPGWIMRRSLDRVIGAPADSDRVRVRRVGW